MSSLRLLVESASSKFSVWEAGSNYRSEAGVLRLFARSQFPFLITINWNWKTGEILGKKSYHKLHSTESKEISATLTFSREKTGPEQERLSQLHYFGKRIKERRHR